VVDATSNEGFLWSPYVIGQTIIFLPCDFFLSFFLSWPNLSRRRVDGCHICTPGVTLVRIEDAGLKRAACGSLKIQDAKKVAKNRHLGIIAQLCRAVSSQIMHVSTMGKLVK